MNFDLSSSLVRDARDIARAIRSVYPGASVEVDPTSAVVRVSGRFSAKEASTAFTQAGIEAILLPDDDAHVSGGRTCCGGCS